MGQPGGRVNHINDARRAHPAAGETPCRSGRQVEVGRPDPAHVERSYLIRQGCGPLRGWGLTLVTAAPRVDSGTGRKGPPSSAASHRRGRATQMSTTANGISAGERHLIPYQGTQLMAYRFNSGQPRGTIVVFGGYDTCIAEWQPAAIAFRDAGLDTVIFDVPGQGTVLDAGMPMTPDRRLPVAAVLDYFNLPDVTLMGFSLGGCLVVRAAAREPRVSRVIVFGVLADFSELAARMAASKTDLSMQWMFSQGARVAGAVTPAAVLDAWHEYHTSDVAPPVTRDVLLMIGSESLGRCTGSATRR